MDRVSSRPSPDLIAALARGGRAIGAHAATVELLRNVRPLIERRGRTGDLDALAVLRELEE